MKMNQQVWALETTMNFMIVLSVLVYASSATNYTVGGDSGWALTSNVQTWSSSYTFSVGDTLVFVYRPVHNVLEVNESAYEDCNLDNPISITNGNYTTVTLDTFDTGSGLKAKIVVKSTDSSGSGNSGTDERHPPSSRSPPSPRQSPPPPSNTPGTPPSPPSDHDFPPSDPNAHGPSSSPSAATKITHKFAVITSVIFLVLIKLMIIQ
ncbi:hypothetical protein MKW98_031232 [Papaver atlanticum]|uniref:Phytocyanin domain-containing protein n=1 Tax=Papaver atlanticum TaxID=357466 RepID=A0AAD4XBF5_9MAGN|nr:hypothetical protein MKW98_031232 [Papaver atlanticum]